MTPRVEILIVSHKPDIQWLEYNLRSIDKFATGFSGVTLVVPEKEKADFIPMAVAHGCKLRGHDLPGHLGAQTQKCLADKHCPDADFIVHDDSDCVFVEPVSPDDYFIDGKPFMLIEEYSRLSGNPWKATVDKALGGDNKWETMRRHCQVNPRGVYNSLRKHIEKRHLTPFVNYTMAQKPDYPWGMSEHNWIGAFALMSPMWSDRYYWIDVAQVHPPKNKLTQWWSHSPPDKLQDMPSGGKGVPLELFKTLGIA